MVSSEEGTKKGQGEGMYYAWSRTRNALVQCSRASLVLRVGSGVGRQITRTCLALYLVNKYYLGAL